MNLDILFRIEDVEKFKNIINFRDFFDNYDQEWAYIYNLENKNILSEIDLNLRKLLEFENSEFHISNFNNYLSELEMLCQDLFTVLEKTIKDKLKFSDEDLIHASILNKQLKELARFRYLKKEYLFIDQDFNSLRSLYDKFKKQISDIDLEQSKIKDIHEKSIDFLKQTQDKNKLLNTIIDSTANDEIKKLYDDIYEGEIKIANKYRKWALWIFAAVGSFLVIGFLIVSIQNWNHLRDPSFIEIKLGWDSLFKTLMLFSLTTPAWYLTKESSKHRQVAYKAKMLGTELAAFPLYAREFKDEERLELRKNLADRFFGQELYGTSNSKADNSASSTEQIKLLAEMNKVTVEAIKVQQTLLGKKE